MGALKGSISISKFYVEGTLPDDFRETYGERIRVRAFRPLDPLDDAVDRAGYCSIEDPFDLELDYEKIFFNNYINLGLRFDRWMIPGPLFKAHFAQAEKAYLAKRGRERLSKREKEELRTAVEKKLRKQVVPAMKVIDVSWNVETQDVRIWSQSAKIHEAFEDLFEKTFELKLVPESPYTAATRPGLSRDEALALDAIEPSAFATTMN